MKSSTRSWRRDIDYTISEYMLYSNLIRSNVFVMRVIPDRLSKRNRIVPPPSWELSISPGAPNIGTNCACIDEFISEMSEYTLTSTTGLYFRCSAGVAEIGSCNMRTYHKTHFPKTEETVILEIPAPSPILCTRTVVYPSRLAAPAMSLMEILSNHRLVVEREFQPPGPASLR